LRERFQQARDQMHLKSNIIVSK